MWCTIDACACVCVYMVIAEEDIHVVHDRETLLNGRHVRSKLNNVRRVGEGGEAVDGDSACGVERRIGHLSVPHVEENAYRRVRMEGEGGG